jgi:hypothetical protein
LAQGGVVAAQEEIATEFTEKNSDELTEIVDCSGDRGLEAY